MYTHVYSVSNLTVALGHTSHLVKLEQHQQKYAVVYSYSACPM